MYVCKTGTARTRTTVVIKLQYWKGIWVEYNNLVRLRHTDFFKIQQHKIMPVRSTAPSFQHHNGIFVRNKGVTSCYIYSGATATLLTNWFTPHVYRCRFAGTSSRLACHSVQGKKRKRKKKDWTGISIHLLVRWLTTNNETSLKKEARELFDADVDKY